MIIHWQGKDWPLDFTDFTVKQGEVIEDTAGMPVGKWLDSFSEGFDSGSPQFLKLLKVVYWLMLNQNGDPAPIGAVDFPVLAFSRAFIAAAAAEAPAAAAEQPDPTPPAPSPATASPGPSTPTGGTSSPPATPAPSPSAPG